MSSYPLGGLARQTDDIGSVELFDVVYDDATYVPSAASALDPKGTLLGRITASGKVTPSDPAAIDGSEIPVAVLGSDVQADGVPSDVFIRMIVGGRVRRERLSIIDASPVTDAVVDSLRDFGIIAERTTNLSKLDNWRAAVDAVSETERITNDAGSIGVSDLVYDAGTIIIAPGAVIPRGTILGRISVPGPFLGVLVPSVAGAGTGAQIPIGVLADDLASPPSLVTEVRYIARGRVLSERLIRSGGTVDATVRDQLRRVGIVPVRSTELARLDN